MHNNLQTTLSVEDIRIKAYHGWYPEERKLGGTYSINVYMFGESRSDADFHSLDTSVNYEHIYSSIMEIMQKEFHLIEHCCKALFDKLKTLAPDNIWEVQLTKIKPPLNFVGQTSFKIKG